MQLEEMGKKLRDKDRKALGGGFRRKGQMPEKQDETVTGGRISFSLVSHLENEPDGDSYYSLVLKGTLGNLESDLSFPNILVTCC